MLRKDFFLCIRKIIFYIYILQRSYLIHAFFIHFFLASGLVVRTQKFYFFASLSRRLLGSGWLVWSSCSPIPSRHKPSTSDLSAICKRRRKRSHKKWNGSTIHSLWSFFSHVFFSCISLGLLLTCIYSPLIIDPHFFQRRPHFFSIFCWPYKISPLIVVPCSIPSLTADWTEQHAEETPHSPFIKNQLLCNALFCSRQLWCSCAIRLYRETCFFFKVTFSTSLCCIYSGMKIKKNWFLGTEDRLGCFFVYIFFCVFYLVFARRFIS